MILTTIFCPYKEIRQLQVRRKKFFTIKIKNEQREGVPKYYGWVVLNVNKFSINSSRGG